MKFVRTIVSVVMAVFFLATTTYADMEEFDSEKMLSDLEKQLELSRDELSKLKPALDAKSEELKKSIHESVDKGFMELEVLSGQLDAATREAEDKLKEALTSEEMQRLKDYLKQIDKQAINQATDELVARLTALLKLTEAQIAELKPVLENAFNQLGEMLNELAREGNKSLQKFQSQYDDFSKELREKLEGALDGEQIKSLDRHRDELRDKIEADLYSA